MHGQRRGELSVAPIVLSSGSVENVLGWTRARIISKEPMHDDYSLLRRYAEAHDHAAFAALVDRYVNFVYNVALRRTNGDAAAASDVTQNAFAALGRQAARLAPDTVLAAWLHSATRSAADKQTPPSSRRAPANPPGTREARNAPLADWEAVGPVLDDAVDELLDSDRAPFVLRFFRRASFAEIGSALAVSEDAARLRVERPLERLRGALGKRGIAMTAAALGAALMAGPAFPAPDGLAARITAQSGDTSAAASTASLRSLFDVKMLVTGLVAAGVAFFVGTRFAARPEPPPQRDPQLEQTLTTLRGENDRLRQQVSSLTAENERLKLATIQAAGRRPAPPAPTPATPRPNAIAAEPASPAGADSTSEANGKTETLADPHLQELKRKIEPALARAILAYRASHQGSDPTAAQDLVPYFTTPQEGADFIEYIEANKRTP